MYKTRTISKNISGRTKFLSARMFQLIELSMPDIIERKEWHDVRKKILDVMNQILRGNKEDLKDCDIVYRPIAVNNNGRVKVKASSDIINLFRKLDFQSDPFLVLLKSSMHDIDIMTSVCDEFGFGKVTFDADNNVYYTIVGEQCLDVLSIFDLIVLPQEVKKKYLDWRKKLKAFYQENNNAR